MLLGICIILACGALVISTAADPLLSRLGVNRWVAVIILAAVLGLSLIEKVYITSRLGFNIGSGALVILMCLVMFLFIKGAGKIKTLITTLIIAAGCYLISALIPWNWDLTPFDVRHIMGLFAGVAAAVLADTRRGALFSAVIGLYLSLAAEFILEGIESYSVWIIGEGVEFAAMMIAAALSILLGDLAGLIKDRGSSLARKNGMPRLKVRN